MSLQKCVDTLDVTRTAQAKARPPQPASSSRLRTALPPVPSYPLPSVAKPSPQAQPPTAAEARMPRHEFQRHQDIISLKALDFELDSEDEAKWAAGGQGVIIFAKHKSNADQRLAIKLPRFYNDYLLLGMDQEFEAMSLLAGAPHTLSLIDMPEVDSFYKLPHCKAIVMPYVDHIFLADIKGAFTQHPELEMVKVWGVAGMRRCTLCLCKAVKHLHDVGLVHGDIKDTNVLIHPSLMELTLCDFGTTRRAHLGVCGNITPGWEAPEQVLPLLTLCFCLYYLLTSLLQLILPNDLGFKDNGARNCDIWAVGLVALAFTIRQHRLMKVTNWGTYAHDLAEMAKAWHRRHPARDSELPPSPVVGPSPEGLTPLSPIPIFAAPPPEAPIPALPSTSESVSLDVWTRDLCLQEHLRSYQGEMDLVSRLAAGPIWTWAAFYALQWEAYLRKHALETFIKVYNK